MILKVRYSDVNNFSKVIEKDSKIIDDEISNILKKLDELTIIWQGSDSAQFHDHATAYFKTMRNIPITMRNMTKSIGVAMDGYRTSEDALTKNISAQVAEYPKVGNRMEKAAAFSENVLQKSEKMVNNYNRLSTDTSKAVSESEKYLKELLKQNKILESSNDPGPNPSPAVEEYSEYIDTSKAVSEGDKYIEELVKQNKILESSNDPGPNQSPAGKEPSGYFGVSEISPKSEVSYEDVGPAKFDTSFLTSRYTGQNTMSDKVFASKSFINTNIPKEDFISSYDTIANEHMAQSALQNVLNETEINELKSNALATLQSHIDKLQKENRK